ncbi:hypothetical protein AB6A40_011587 [Gnathostoma spinigerum]|uniref:Uncharacterized protein n=1 Tax=Gnathostoma spinigerum TaxID=75299 RepID=A0ABD6EY31_9BILA
MSEPKKKTNCAPFDIGRVDEYVVAAGMLMSMLLECDIDECCCKRPQTKQTHHRTVSPEYTALLTVNVPPTFLSFFPDYLPSSILLIIGMGVTGVVSYSKISV